MPDSLFRVFSRDRLNRQKTKRSTMKSIDRGTNGRFKQGNPGGPGRPRRAVETDYLGALSESIPLETWRSIVAKAVEQALPGDAKSREWLGTFLMGKPTGRGLRQLAIEEGGIEATLADVFGL